MKPHLFSIPVSLLLSLAVHATEWPKSFTADGTDFKVYQPQITSWSGTVVSADVALSAQPVGAAKPTFGTVKLQARTAVNKAADSVHLSDVQGTVSNFPSAPESAKEYTSALIKQAATWGSDLSLKAMEANLAVNRAEGGAGKPVAVQNNVPKFFFSEQPAILVLVDGEPALRVVPQGSLLRVINTPALILMDKSSGSYYLRANDEWFTAAAIEGPWSVDQSPPAQLGDILSGFSNEKHLQLFSPAPEQQQGQVAATPVVYVSTVPAELIITQGPAQFQQVSGTQLLAVTNSTSHLFMDITSQTYYLVISGRWFSAPQIDGPWQFVAANKLPADFAKIPETHPSGAVLASVAKTPQAQEAAIVSSIPQTATISRQATAELSYAGGKPDFAPIEGTKMAYARNSEYPIIRISGDQYYAVYDGVWFTAPTANGPWRVADSIPDEIYTIPPSSPIFYSTGVYVYSSTPEYVTVGYTPLYFGTCLAPEGVVVYGTGYYYPPYISGNYWIGPPLTYGFGAGFACGLVTGFAFGVAWDHGWGVNPWWGPWRGGYRGGNWNRVNINRVNVYNKWGGNVRISNNRVNNISNNQVRRNVNNINQNTIDNRLSHWENSHSDAAEKLQEWSKDNPEARQRLQDWEKQHGPVDREKLGQYRQMQPQQRQQLEQEIRSREAATQLPSRGQAQSQWNSIQENNVFAGHDGHPYRATQNGDWQRYQNGNWQAAESHARQTRQMNSQRYSRSVGEVRSRPQVQRGGGMRRSGGRR